MVTAVRSRRIELHFQARGLLPMSPLARFYPGAGDWHGSRPDGKGIVGDEGGRAMPETGEDRIRRLQEEEVKRIRQVVRPRPVLPGDLPTIPYTALAEASPDSPLATEWNFY